MESAENLSVLVAFGAGLLSFLSPCVLPLVPSYLAYITGMSYDDLNSPAPEVSARKKLLLNAIFYVLGFSSVFIILGASFSLLGKIFTKYLQEIQTISGFIIIFFGLTMIGLFKIPLLMRTKDLIPIRDKPAGYIGSSLIGISFGAAWTPCVGPILGSILFLAGSSKSVSNGMFLLSIYSLGLAIPFLLTALASSSFLSLFRRLGKWTHFLHIGGGILLVIVGILIITGYFTVLNSYFINITPPWLLRKI